MSDTLLRLQIPAATLEIYEKLASEAGKTLEQYLLDHLQRTASFTSINPLYFSDEERHELEIVLGKILNTPKEALKHLKRTQELRVGPVKVTLPANLLERIKTRCFRHPLEKVLVKETTEGLERFVGIR